MTINLGLVILNKPESFDRLYDYADKIFTIPFCSKLFDLGQVIVLDRCLQICACLLEWVDFTGSSSSLVCYHNYETICS